MVFQSYALYPHLTVRENLAFGLKMRKTPKAQIAERVGDAAAMLGLEQLLERRPGQLSGGQRQRVAMGRAVVRRPKVFLFDEPLSNLDATLRGQMRVELMRLHQKLSATMIYVTHDQVEAMTLADRIAVLDKGALMQVGPPSELYERPANLFVAKFIGTPEMNLCDAAAARRVGLVGELPAGTEKIGMRAESLTLGRGSKAVVEVVEHLGWEALIHLQLDELRIVARVESREAPRPGDKVRVSAAPEALHAFDADGARLDLTSRATRTSMTAVVLAALHVVVWHAYRAEEQKALERCAQVYNQSHPDVVIEPVAVPFDAFSPKLEAAIPRGNGPDLFIGSHEGIGEWSRTGLILPIEKHIQPGELTAFLDGTVEPLRIGAHLYGLPLTFKSLALFYRTDRVGRPRPPTTSSGWRARRTRRAATRWSTRRAACSITRPGCTASAARSSTRTGGRRSIRRSRSRR